MLFSAMITEVRDGLNVLSASTFITTAMIQRWICMAMDWALSYKKWPFLEYKGTDLIDATGTYPYPTSMKTKSAFLVTVAGERFEKIRYEDYLKYLEDDSSGDDKVWAEFDRDIYINGNACSTGDAICIYGQAIPASLTTGKTGVATTTTALRLIDATKSQFVAGDVDKTVWNKIDNTFAIVTGYNSTTSLTIDTDIMASGEDYELYAESGTTPFATAEPSGDEAIVLRAISRGYKKIEGFETEARLAEASAKELLDNIWDRIQEAKPREVLKTTRMFKKINILKGTTGESAESNIGKF